MSRNLEGYFEKLEKWRKESQKLRSIVLGFPLREELKWGEPCYTLEGKNIVLIGGFKEYCALMFFKGVLIPDPHGILVAPGSVQVGRQIRFTSVREIAGMEPIVKSYIAAAIEVENSGLQATLKPHSAYTMPEELQRKLDSMPRLKKAFAGLTPGRQRGYMLFVTAAKQAKTRESRVEKCIQPILEGKGLND
jgi:uncharacterized protein YdeI (YjbR/CyaY-like superfamily)